MLSFKFTRRNPKIPKLLRALSIGQISKAMIRPTQKTAVYVAENKLRGQVLKRRSGNLAQSLLGSVKTSGMRASFGTSLKYGAVHEYGMTITPKNGSVLAFNAGGKMVFARSVTIPKRPWLEPGTKEFVKSGKYVELFKAELLKELNR